MLAMTQGLEDCKGSFSGMAHLFFANSFHAYWHLSGDLIVPGWTEHPLQAQSLARGASGQEQHSRGLLPRIFTITEVKFKGRGGHVFQRSQNKPSEQA